MQILSGRKCYPVTALTQHISYLNTLNQQNSLPNTNMKLTTIITHFLLIILTNFPLLTQSYHDYAEALTKSILFFEGQRSGYLPSDQRQTWRANSGLGDGWTVSTDLTGGYYDAGDNVKFHFPMAFTTTMLSWSVIEFGELMPVSEKRNALVAIRWATDYLLKTVSQLPDRIFVQVCRYKCENKDGLKICKKLWF